MGRTVNRYTLCIVVDEKEVIPIAKGSLQMIDEVTTNFKNKKELLSVIKDLFNLDIEGKNVRLTISYNQNKKIRYIRILYATNKDAFDNKAVGAKLLKYSKDRDFVIKFVKRYSNSPYLSTLSSEVIRSIMTNEVYLEPLQRIIDLTFGNYKSTRDIYFFIKKYEGSEQYDVETPTIKEKDELVLALKRLKMIYENKQLSIFDLLNNNNIQSHKEIDNETPKIKQRKS